ncbi:MAG: hypothetical protein PHD43_23690 [Methylococcales bacterium]|nr:hypothetical protein [Methylococcales bacterium]
MRADAKRILIVTPGSLVKQWQDELYEKFGVEFKIFSQELVQTSHSGNALDFQWIKGLELIDPLQRAKL